jgi:N-acetylmuramoyl-L-alanine amidase
MKRYNWIIDNGHGVDTAGKRSPNWEKGVLLEGVKNREIAKLVLTKLRAIGVLCTELVPELDDVSLGERVRRASKIPNGCLISIHCDAFTNESANGASAFTTVGQGKADKISSAWYNAAKQLGLPLKARTDNADGDPDKEADFFILRKTPCPAVLIENGFMTNRSDYAFLMSKTGVELLADVIVAAIVEIELVGL